MYLVTESKYKVNQLGFDLKKKEYVHYHLGKEIWREKGDDSLFEYFNCLRANHTYIDEDEIAKLPTSTIWEKYKASC